MRTQKILGPDRPHLFDRASLKIMGITSGRCVGDVRAMSYSLSLFCCPQEVDAVNARRRGRVSLNEDGTFGCNSQPNAAVHVHDRPFDDTRGQAKSSTT